MRSLQVALLVFCCWFAAPASAAAAPESEIDCLGCHGDLTAGMTEHAALAMGCRACHAGIDAGDVPHRITNGAKRGLASDLPGLCYGCHNEQRFVNKQVHAALTMGCGSCHNPHGSKHPRLMTTGVPELCFGCHDRGLFARREQHGPSAAGMCLHCHDPHAARHDKLLVTDPVRLCSNCHASVLEKPHLISGMGGKGHPVGTGKKGGEKRRLKDPARPGRSFSCISCHDPHSADMPKMIRFPMISVMDICANCHYNR